MKIFNFLSEIVLSPKILITKISVFSDHESMFFGIFFLENSILKLHFHLPSNLVYLSSSKNSWGINVFSVNNWRIIMVCHSA